MTLPDKETKIQIERDLSNSRSRWDTYWADDIHKPQIAANCSDMADILTILNMAISGKVPDAHFSDYECNLWSEMRAILRKYDACKDI